VESASQVLALANSSVGGDRLGSPAALGAWLDANAPDAGAAGDAVLLRLGDFRALRDAVTITLRRTVDRRALPPGPVEVLNAASAMSPAWPVLGMNGTAATVEIQRSDTSETTRILASIARSAIELLGGPDAARLRGCPACGRFFVTSRRAQLWCSAACGNRSRVARHRARRTDATM
jgi:predicted RNA-binding Zn ribbon-like protein